MSNTSKNAKEHLYFVSKLGIERCHQQLAQLHALIHFSAQEKEGVMMSAMTRLLASLESELAMSNECLDRLASKI